jgi:hypothetical protein
MFEILQEVGLNVTQFLALLVISTMLLVFFFRSFIFGLLDPINVFLMTMCADAVLVMGMDWDTGAKTEFVWFVFFFWVGMVLAGRIPTEHPMIEFDRNGLFELEIVLLVLWAIIILANLYLGISIGFPLFSSDPSVSKVTDFTGGLGIIKRLNGGPLYFLCCGSTILALVGYKRYLALSMLLVSSILVALSGSKGALLPMIFILAFVTHHKGLSKKSADIKKMKRYAIPAFAAACVVAFTVVIRDTGSLFGGLFALAKRLLFSADVVLFYFPRRGEIPELRGAGSLDYLKYLLDPTLGLFRLKTYAAPLGTIIAGNLETGFGPNAQFFVRADIFFGPVAGCVYCIVIGYLIGLMRKKLFTLQTENPLVFTFALMVAVSAFLLAYESQMFVTEMIDAGLVVIPLWGVAFFARIAATYQRKLSEVIG